MDRWTFLTNHSHILVCIANDPTMRLRDVAAAVGVTERAAQRIVADLVDAGYLSRERVGRRNHYQFHPEKALRHPMEGQSDVGSLISLFSTAAQAAPPKKRPTRPHAANNAA